VIPLAGLQPLLATQNFSVVVRILQWAVIVLVFVFFMRVVRAVWVEVRPAGPRQSRAERRAAKVAQVPEVESPPEPRRPKKKQLFLEVLEPAEYQGLTYELDDELTIGRSPGCGVPTTYDVYSSTLHARLFRRADQLWVEDLGSTNGTFVNSERLTKPSKLMRDDILQVGATVFEVTR
jgi:pSer/pThr/pTyr-binding forkhead associated (FHA) protein